MEYSISDEVVIADPWDQPEVKMIVYCYAHAFTKCDCGKELVLTQKVYGNRTYTGECQCGRKYKLLNGKFKVNG